jgi:hypothetical protein
MRLRRIVSGPRRHCDVLRVSVPAAPELFKHEQSTKEPRRYCVISVRYHEAAEDELRQELGFLELRAKGLGRQFLSEVRRVEDFIARYP